jgi:hypothetical protein
MWKNFWNAVWTVGKEAAWRPLWVSWASGLSAAGTGVVIHALATPDGVALAASARWSLAAFAVVAVVWTMGWVVEDEEKAVGKFGEAGTVFEHSEIEFWLRVRGWAVAVEVAACVLVGSLAGAVLDGRGVSDGVSTTTILGASAAGVLVGLTLQLRPRRASSE